MSEGTTASEGATTSGSTASSERDGRILARARRWAVNLLLLGVSTAVTLVVAEGFLRLVAPQQLILLRPDVWRPNDGLGWEQAPNLDTVVNTGEREVRLLTDGQGHRIGPGRRPAPAHRVLALGDSYLAALQVEHEQTLTALAEQRLTRDSGTPVEIVNASAGGWGPNHYLLEARRELPRQPYDQVVVFLYLGNDVIERARDHFPPKKATLRHDFQWPQQLTRDDLADSLLRPINDLLETRSHLFQLFKRRLRFVLMRVGLSVRRFPEVLLREQASSERWRVSAEVCRSIAGEAAAHGLPILFVLLPGVSEVDRQIGEITARAAGLEVSEIDLDQPSSRMRRELADLGLTVLDATPALRAAHEAGLEDLYGRVDYHFGIEGHRVVADAIVPLLLESLKRGGDRAGIPLKPESFVADRS